MTCRLVGKKSRCPTQEGQMASIWCVRESASRRILRQSGRGLWCLTVLVLSSALPAPAQDDTENSTPTAWWYNSGQSFNDIDNTIKAKNARVINITVDNSSPNPFT